MHAIHIIGPDAGPVFLGKGSSNEEVIRSRLAPEAKHFSVWVSPAIPTADQMNMILLMTRDSFIHDGGATETAGWWGLPYREAVLLATAVRLAHAHRPIFHPWAESLRRVMDVLGIDGATLAAAIGTSPARMSRLMTGRGSAGGLTLDEYAALRWWCRRLGKGAEFDVCFPLDGDLPTPPGRPNLTIVGGRETA